MFDNDSKAGKKVGKISSEKKRFLVCSDWSVLVCKTGGSSHGYLMGLFGEHV